MRARGCEHCEYARGCSHLRTEGTFPPSKASLFPVLRTSPVLTPGFPSDFLRDWKPAGLGLAPSARVDGRVHLVTQPESEKKKPRSLHTPGTSVSAPASDEPPQPVRVGGLQQPRSGKLSGKESSGVTKGHQAITRPHRGGTQGCVLFTVTF